MPDEEINVEEEVEEGSSKINKVLIIIIIGVIILLAGTGIFIYITQSKDDYAGDTDIAYKDSHEPYKIYSFEEEFTINLSDYDERHYIYIKPKQLSLGFYEADYSNASKIIAARLQQARDLVHTIILSKKSHDLENVEGKRRLTEELKKELNNNLFGNKLKDPIKQVYIEYMVQ